MEFYLFGDRGGILTEEPADVLEGHAFCKGIGDELPVVKGKVLLVARYQL